MFELPQFVSINKFKKNFPIFDSIKDAWKLNALRAMINEERSKSDSKESCLSFVNDLISMKDIISGSKSRDVDESGFESYIMLSNKLELDFENETD